MVKVGELIGSGERGWAGLGREVVRGGGITFLGRYPHWIYRRQSIHVLDTPLILSSFERALVLTQIQ